MSKNFHTLFKLYLSCQHSIIDSLFINNCCLSYNSYITSHGTQNINPLDTYKRKSLYIIFLFPSTNVASKLDFRIPSVRVTWIISGAYVMLMVYIYMQKLNSMAIEWGGRSHSPKQGQYSPLVQKSLSCGDF